MPVTTSMVLQQLPHGDVVAGEDVAAAGRCPRRPRRPCPRRRRARPRSCRPHPHRREPPRRALEDQLAGERRAVVVGPMSAVGYTVTASRPCFDRLAHEQRGLGLAAVVSPRGPGGVHQALLVETGTGRAAPRTHGWSCNTPGAALPLPGRPPATLAVPAMLVWRSRANPPRVMDTMPAAWKTVSAPANARTSEAWSARSPVTTCTSRPARGERSEVGRASARTGACPVQPARAPARCQGAPWPRSLRTYPISSCVPFTSSAGREDRSSR